MLIALIAGTGIDEMPYFRSAESTRVQTRFGEADVIHSSVNGHRVLLLARHGRRHSIPPDKINVKAQIAALKKCGADRVIGVCAVGSLKAGLGPGSFAVTADFIDFTKRGQHTFFDEPGAPVAHTDFANPYCPEIREALSLACADCGLAAEADVVYIGVDGPRYETPAEIRLFESWGAHVVGMTNVAEAVLAREAGLCYARLAIVTNLASAISPTPLSHDEVRLAMMSCSEKLDAVLMRAIERMPSEARCGCRANTALVV